MSIAEKLITIAENEQKVYEAGQKAEYDRFWDNFQENGNRNQYQCAFAMWNDELFKPKYDLLVTQTFGGTQMFWNSRITDIDEILNKLNKSLITEGCKNFSQMFQTSKTKTVPTLDISLANSLSYTFASNSIKTIKLLKVSENTVFHPQTFQNATALENITFEGVIGNDISIKDSNKLTHESLVSIINALKDFGATETFENAEAWFDGPPESVGNTKENFPYNVINTYESVDGSFSMELESDMPLYLNVANATPNGDISKIKTAMISSDGTLTLTFEPTTTKTLTIGSTNLEKLTDAEKKIATDKGWTLA